MTDYKEEQAQELEVLKSIYPDELEEIGPGEFLIKVTPEEQDSLIPLILALHIKYTPNYPDQLPEITIDITNGSLSPEDYDKLNTEVISVVRISFWIDGFNFSAWEMIGSNILGTLDQAEDSTGMAMVFTLVSLLKDSLSLLVIENQEQRKRDEEARVRKEIEAEQARFQGTKVTIPAFIEWKQNFERERLEKERLEKGAAALKREEMKRLKLTGRQLFEQDESLAKSDATFMEEGDVTVDISLFEHEEDLGSEESDDEVLNILRNSTD
ncbi:hypothetical protein G9A89_005992 [Geosiphon pyriformis]|nr:hypothetical protein G9A89_005992 [Geosiphon pyriformis]